MGGIRLIVSYLDEREHLVGRTHIAFRKDEEQILVFRQLGTLGDGGIALIAFDCEYRVLQLSLLFSKLCQLGIEGSIEELALRVLVEQRLEVFQVAFSH